MANHTYLIRIATCFTILNIILNLLIKDVSNLVVGTRQLEIVFKVIASIIYDDYMLEPYQGGFFGNDLELSTSPIDSSDVLPVHLDFGFVYAFNNNFRFGIHFQQPWLGFYWKF